MLPKLEYNLTNWTDGMKISRRHFMDSENALLDQLRDTNAHAATPFNYGLLEPQPGDKTALDINVFSSGNNKYKISVGLCRAVTMGGCRIELIPGVHPELVSDNDIFSDDFEGKPAGSAFLAVISVDPFNRLPFGVAAADEFPPRNPSGISAYRLSLIPREAIHTASIGAFHMPIARFSIRNNELIRDPNYIPPCAVVAAHPGTKQIYNTIAQQLNLIQEGSTVIVQKVVEGAQNHALAQNVKNICIQVIRHISSENFYFRLMYPKQSPVYLANCVVQVANEIGNAGSFMPEKEKEEMLQYFAFWNELSPGKFEEILGAVISSDYEHENLYDYFQPLLVFLKTWGDLIEKLKALKIIGQRPEKFDFGGRTMETPKDKGKSKFSIFD